MGRKPSPDNIALQLYHEHKTDREIAETTGKTIKAIQSWRHRQGLKCNRETEGRGSENVHYRDVLTPEQADKMSDFLRALSWASKIAIKAGEKPDVLEFAKIWSGRLSTKEEVVYWREYRRKKRKNIAVQAKTGACGASK